MAIGILIWILYTCFYAYSSSKMGKRIEKLEKEKEDLRFEVISLESALRDSRERQEEVKRDLFLTQDELRHFKSLKNN